MGFASGASIGVAYVEDAFKFNVRERVYKLDPRPISLGCECFACTHHSIGYIHHLLSTHEMLASVLLNMYVSFSLCPHALELPSSLIFLLACM